MHPVWNGVRARETLGEFEESIRNVLLQQSDTFQLGDVVYYRGSPEKFRVSFVLRSGNRSLVDITPEETERVLKLTQEEIERSLGRKLQSKTNETWSQKEYQLFVRPEKVLQEDFEKTQLGTFLYLLYLKEKFENDSEVCVMISELGPLLRRGKELETDLNILTETQFKQKHPTFAPYYESFVRSRKDNPTIVFRLGLLYAIISVAGPYLFVINEQAFLSRTFRVLFERCRTSGSRYTVSLANITAEGWSHSTVLIFDNQQKVLERWDPAGQSSSEQLLDRSIRSLDEVLTNFANEVGYTYLSPIDFCPRLGIQEIESEFSGKMGYCLSWSVIYAEERLKSSAPREFLAEDLLKVMVESYGVTDALSIQDWLDRRIDEIFSRMDRLYTELSTALGNPVRYVDGKLVYEV